MWRLSLNLKLHENIRRIKKGSSTQIGVKK